MATFYRKPACGYLCQYRIQSCALGAKHLQGKYIPEVTDQQTDDTSGVRVSVSANAGTIKKFLVRGKTEWNEAIALVRVPRVRVKHSSTKLGKDKVIHVNIVIKLVRGKGTDHVRSDHFAGYDNSKGWGYRKGPEVRG